MSRSLIRFITVAGVAAASIAMTAVPALAHIGVSSPDATQGGIATVTFRTPNESEKANTVELKLQLPADQPMAFLSVLPQAGWTYTVTRAKLSSPITDDDGNQVTDYPSVIDWKATAGGIKPGEFALFTIAAGPLPKADQVVFKAVQTYDDGTVSSWIEEPAPGSTEEPENPAPILELTAGTESGSAPAPSAPASAAAASAAPAASDGAGNGPVVGAYVVGGVGLLAGLAALGLAVTARRRRTGAADTAPERISTGS